MSVSLLNDSRRSTTTRSWIKQCILDHREMRRRHGEMQRRRKCISDLSPVMLALWSHLFHLSLASVRPRLVYAYIVSGSAFQLLSHPYNHRPLRFGQVLSWSNSAVTSIDDRRCRTPLRNRCCRSAMTYGPHRLQVCCSSQCDRKLHILSSTAEMKLP